MKDNAIYDVLQTNEIPKNRSIRKNEIILFNGVNAADKCDHELRRIEVWNEENQPMIALLTNHLSFGSPTIAAMLRFNPFTYRDLEKWLDDPVNTPPFVPDD
jgi:hypothetical protein